MDLEMNIAFKYKGEKHDHAYKDIDGRVFKRVMHMLSNQEGHIFTHRDYENAVSSAKNEIQLEHKLDCIIKQIEEKVKLRKKALIQEQIEIETDGLKTEVQRLDEGIINLREERDKIIKEIRDFKRQSLEKALKIEDEIDALDKIENNKIFPIELAKNKKSS